MDDSEGALEGGLRPQCLSIQQPVLSIQWLTHATLNTGYWLLNTRTLQREALPFMVFDEDHSRARAGFAAENLAIIRHVAFDMIRLDAGTHGGIKRKKKAMTWNQEKLLNAVIAA